MSEERKRVAEDRQADHIASVELGGAPERAHVARQPSKRPKRLRVLSAKVTWEPRAGLPPGGRAECRSGERPCPYVQCSHHLWMVDARDRQGDPRAPRGSSSGGWGDRLEARSTLVPRWLEVPTPACCELDLRDREPDGIEVHMIADALGVSVRTVYSVIASGKAKLRDNQEMHEVRR